MKYIKEFDGLRAFAVIAVMFQHYLAQYRILSLFGSSGVTLFFVLSGYLITQILLKEKEVLKIDFSKNLSRIGSVLKIFYIRRSLRIFPIYYITLLILVILNIDSARLYWHFHFFYLSNFLYTFHGNFDRLTHFWSLAVEEQFYLLWPFIILLMPLKGNRVRFYMFLIVASLLFKVWMIYTYSIESYSSTYLMPACIEAFAAGALAVELKGKNINKTLLFTILLASLLLFMLLQLLLIISHTLFSTFIIRLFGRTTICVFSAVLLLIIVKQLHGKTIKNILTFNPLTYLGRISYGIYIYHMFIPSIFIYVQNHFHFNLKGSGFNLLLQFITTFILAHFSYLLIEKPLNNLKAKFAYI